MACIDELKKEKDDLEHKLAESEAKLNDLRDRNMKINLERKSLTKQLMDVKEENTSLFSKITERDKELNGLKQYAAENNPTALKSRIAALEQKSERLEREATFPHLKFGPDSARDYANLSGKDKQTVINKLTLLDESALEWRVTGGARPSWKCKVTDESDTVKDGRKSSGKRRFKSYHGDTREFMWHARFGSSGSSGRIHLRFDPSSREVEIGYIGKKLGT